MRHREAQPARIDRNRGEDAICPGAGGMAMRRMRVVARRGICTYPLFSLSPFLPYPPDCHAPHAGRCPTRRNRKHSERCCRIYCPLVPVRPRRSKNNHLVRSRQMDAPTMLGISHFGGAKQSRNTMTATISDWEVTQNAREMYRMRLTIFYFIISTAAETASYCNRNPLISNRP
jgi:hypothetical protein